MLFSFPLLSSLLENEAILNIIKPVWYYLLRVGPGQLLEKPIGKKKYFIVLGKASCKVTEKAVIIHQY